MAACGERTSIASSGMNLGFSVLLGLSVLFVPDKITPARYRLTDIVCGKAVNTPRREYCGSIQVYLQLSTGCALCTCRDAGGVPDSRPELNRCSVEGRECARRHPRWNPLSARPRARCPEKFKKKIAISSFRPLLSFCDTTQMQNYNVLSVEDIYIISNLWEIDRLGKEKKAKSNFYGLSHM